ncbi:O-antigen ligase family protein [Sediminitomix flava]|uniref:O-antigen ligase-like membrane protein n=1 Tax=Sediminitomix flava TaxID=379075 RepID=A0A315Z5M9_SEDFL|nr:O-antigen ligase family protein [Sediminitomix flava]PWJ38509.1 O-antigen ligase-like membrane protein [Sediminitomix flava]
MKSNANPQKSLIDIVLSPYWVRRWGLALLFFICLGIVYLSSKGVWLIGFLIAGACMGAPVLLATMVNTKVGVYMMVSIAFIMSMFLRLIQGVPIGLLMDFTILLMTVGELLKDIEKREYTFFKTPLSWVVYIWMGWHFLELANPEAASRVAWFYVARPAVGYIMIYFVTYRFLNSRTEIKKLLSLIIFLSFFSGAWGVAQFVFGYFPFEMNYIIQNDAVHLVFIQGRWRSFGTMGSPAHFGVIMAYMVVFCILLIGFKKTFWGRFYYIVVIVTCFMGLVYSGARSGIAVIPLAGATVVGLSKNMKLYVTSLFAGIGLFFVIIMPTDNYHIKRIQSTFKSDEDESFQVREKNKEMIIPWIMAHPMGGGLGSTGVWGQRFSPGTFLANFPPDSGYVRVAVEMGWIGYLLYLLLWGAVLIKTLLMYLKVKDEELRWIAIGIFGALCPLVVVETAQDIVGKLPSNMLFWIWVAMLLRALEIGTIPNRESIYDEPAEDSDK